VKYLILKCTDHSIKHDFCYNIYIYIYKYATKNIYLFFSLAFTCLKDYQKAVSCYKKACELDPENLGYQRNYQLTLNNLQTVTEQEIPQDDSSPTTANSAMGSPNLMETAARLMNDPEVNTVFVILVTLNFIN
jgi:tetratricopeptide (TPR) repeat protein